MEFKKEYLDLVKDLSPINPCIIFDKDEDNVIIKRSDASNSIIYTLEAPKDNFNFEAEDIAFYNYPEFHQILSVFDEPKLIESAENRITISEKQSKINYRISDSEVIPKVQGEGHFESPDCEFTITVEQLDKIKKMIGLISSEKIRFKVTKDSEDVICDFFNLSHSNNWEKPYSLDSISEETFELIISAKIFTLMPRNSYVISIKEDGIVKLNYVHDEYKLDIYIPEDTEA